MNEFAAQKAHPIVWVSTLLLLVGLLLGVWIVLGIVKSRVPSTGDTTWPDPSGAFVSYGVSEATVAYLIVSLRTEEEIDRRHEFHDSFLHRSSVITIAQRDHGDVDVSLGATPQLILIDRKGEVKVEDWEVSRVEFQAVIDALESAPTVPGSGRKESVSLVLETLRSWSHSPVPKDFGTGAPDPPARRR